MGLPVKSRTLVMRVQVTGCQDCSMFEEGQKAKDDWCKLLKSSLWEMLRDDPDDWDGLFPKRCPLPKQGEVEGV